MSHFESPKRREKNIFDGDIYTAVEDRLEDMQNMKSSFVISSSRLTHASKESNHKSGVSFRERELVEDPQRSLATEPISVPKNMKISSR